MTVMNSFSSPRRDSTLRHHATPLEPAMRGALHSSLVEPGATILSRAVPKPLKLLPRKMLLVGECKRQMRTALHLLAGWDVAVEVVANGADAVQVASTGEFDLILIDAANSVLDGVFIGSRLRHLERKQHGRIPVPLVARLSGEWPIGEHVLRSAGVTDVLTMATEGAAVAECLRRWGAGHYGLN